MSILFETRDTARSVSNIVTGRVDSRFGLSIKERKEALFVESLRCKEHGAKKIQNLDSNLKEINNNNISYLKIMAGVGVAAAIAATGGLIAPSLLPWGVIGVPATFALKHYGLTYAGVQAYKSHKAIKEVASIPLDYSQSIAKDLAGSILAMEGLLKGDGKYEPSKDVQNIFAAPYEDGMILDINHTDLVKSLGGCNVNDLDFGFSS